MTNPVVVGVDIGGTKIAAATVDPGGSTGPVIQAPTPAAVGPDAILDAVSSLVSRLAAGTTLAGVGIGTAGVVDAATGSIVSSTQTLRGWKGTDVAGGLRSRLGLPREAPIEVRNDVDAHALGEQWCGAGQGADTVLMAAVGTGVGGALVLDGTLRTGSRHCAGEIAHIPAPGAEHLRCTCGRMGHLEAIASGPGILRHYRSLGGEPAVTSGLQVASRMDVDPVAEQAVTDAGAALGRVLAGLATTIDPDTIIIGGGFAEPGPWWQAVERALRDELIDALTGLQLVPARLGATAAILGAAREAIPKSALTPPQGEHP